MARIHESLSPIEQQLVDIFPKAEPGAPTGVIRNMTAEGVMESLSRVLKMPAKAEAADKAVPDLVCIGDVEEKAVDWFWRPYVPYGMLTLLEGDPAAGKSWIALYLGAELSRGRTLDNRSVEPASTLYLTNEMALSETLAPRWKALGGDPRRLHILRGGKTSEEDTFAITLADTALLTEAVQSTQAKLLVVDPIQSYFGATVDMHRANQTRPILDKLARLAEKHHLASLMIRHITKAEGGRPLYRGQGSADITGAARSQLLAGSLADGSAKALCHTKPLTRHGMTLGYTIEATEDGRGKFSFTGESSLTASDLLAAKMPIETKQDSATVFLEELLRHGSRSVNEIHVLAELGGIKPITLRRARQSLGIVPRKDGKGGWLWGLP